MNKLLLQLLFSFILMLCIGTNYSQKIDQRIIDVYGNVYVAELSKSNPERIEYLTYYLDHSYEIIKSKNQSGEKCQVVSSCLKKLKNETVNNYIPDLNNFNVLMYDFPRDRKLKKAYRLDDSNYVFVFYSEEEFVKNFNIYKKKL